jgi:hypothetical protein
MTIQSVIDASIPQSGDDDARGSSRGNGHGASSDRRTARVERDLSRGYSINNKQVVLEISPIEPIEEEMQIEGLDPSEGVGWSQYSLDSVFVRSESRSVSDIIRRIDQKRCILDPEFQRDFVWPEDKQSKLIESCIMRIPLPVFYLAEADDGRIIIVDGLQRLTTFHRFVKGLFRLKGLSSGEDADHQLEDKRFSQLPLKLQERILDTNLITYILDAKAPERARLDIFERVNSGVPLTRQQMRNALYSGPATAWLKAAASSYQFRTASGGGLDPKTMRDREAINRFCAFILLRPASYRGDMDAFMAQALSHMNSLSSAHLSDLLSIFNNSMILNRELFGEHAFRKSLATLGKATKRHVLNIALFDVCSVHLATFGHRIILDKIKVEAVKLALARLIDNKDFVTAITYSTNSTKAVVARFAMTEAAIENVLD